jgi:hypothetical protein
MTRASAIVAVLITVVWLQPRAAAHHSLTAEFDTSKTITVTGVITEMEWKNPHSWLHIDVKTPRGQVEKWQIEFASPNSLMRRGWRRSDLPPKSAITITGYPSRDTTSKVMTATDVKLPDGRTLFAGMPTTGTP